MIVRVATVAAVLASSAQAFLNTSPFFLYSTTPPAVPLDSLQVSSASAITSKITDTLRLCASDAYILITQPGVSSSDFTTRRSAPHLQSWLNQTEAGLKARNHLAYTVNEVVGEVSAAKLVSQIKSDCGASIVQVDASTGIIPSGSNATPRIVNVNFPHLQEREAEKRVGTLADHDSFLHAIVSSHGGQDFTIIYMTTPPEEHWVVNTPPYEMEDDKFQQVLHTDLKRDVRGSARNGTSKAPVFEKYAFLNQGIFAGLTAGIILLSMIYVGISAIASVQVSYFAFSKEMGPSQQKKQQ